MSSTDVHKFSSDRPIKDIQEDLLNRADFSTDLANALSSWHGKDSLVVALHGDWGSGKSSIKNMALKMLNETNQRNPVVIEFTPWEWAAQEKITSSFFQEISKSVDRKDKSKSGKELSKILSKWGRHLNTSETVISGFSAATPTIFIISSIILGAWGSLSNEAHMKDISLLIIGIFGLFGAFLKWGKTLLANLNDNIVASIKEQEKNLNDIRLELNNILSIRESPLIVVMDDLDRLTSDELRMVFQLIKANMQFPNIVFLLIFQRDLVEEKLTDGKQSGRDYLEKIIQVPFDIPKIETGRLHKLLFNEIDKILEQDNSAVKMFDPNRWGNIFYGALHAYFDNLRNIYRYISTLSFHFSILRGKTAFEVNPVDLIAIECLRIFEPDVYKEISQSKSIFTTIESGRNSIREEKTKNKILSIIEKSTNGKKDYVQKILKQLFPTIECTFGGMYHSFESADFWLREMRVCHPSNFDKYFQFSIPKGELSNSDLQEMLSLTADSDRLSNFILSLNDRGILANALAQFSSFTQEIPLTNGHTYIKTLLDIGDKIDHSSTGITTFNSNTHAVILTTLFLRKISDIKSRSQLLLQCFKNSNGISIVEHILQADENKRNLSETDILLADNEFNEIKIEFVRKLNNLSENTPELLISHEHFASFLYRWKKWGDDKKITAWLKSQISTTDGCTNFIKAFVITSSSQTIGEYVAKITNTINLEEIQKFIDLESIIESLNKIREEELNSTYAAAVKVFKTALERREKGDFND